MAIGILFVGLILIVTAIRGTHGQLFNLVINDMTGGSAGAGHGFLVWLAAIVAVGMLGYYKPLRGASHLLIGLIVLAIFVSNQGVFAKASAAFTGSIPQGQAPADATTAALPPGFPVEQVGGSGSGASGAIGAASGAIGAATKIFGMFGF
jgi:hypothetical protein